MPLDVHYLQVFKALLSECSISQAANRLNTSPSNVKRIVSTLEGEVGVPLFDGSQRGRVEPTPHADLLEKAMQPFLGEMETLRSLASEIREKERVVRVATHSWFRMTDYFSKWLESFRKNSRVELTVVEVEHGTARAMVDSGGCDVYVGPTVICGKRLLNVDLPEMAAGIGLVGNQPPPRHLAELESLGSWGIHLPGLRSKAAEWLQTIESAGGGSGRLISHSDFLKWSANPQRSPLQAVISPIPTARSEGQAVVWHPLKPLGGIRVTSSALSQHPYDFLGAAIQAAVANLMGNDGSF